jgi:hypothetical protein
LLAMLNWVVELAKVRQKSYGADDRHMRIGWIRKS